MFGTKSRANKRASSDDQPPAAAATSTAKNAGKRMPGKQAKTAGKTSRNEANRLDKLEQKKTVQKQKSEDQCLAPKREKRGGSLDKNSVI